MKKLAIGAGVGFMGVAILAIAQTFAPPSIGSNGPIATSPSQCPVSAAHGYSLCPVETGTGTGAIYVSVNGSAPALLQGTPGPAGPQGIQGIPGPVQSFASVTCTAANLNNVSGLAASGCTEK